MPHLTTAQLTKRWPILLGIASAALIWGGDSGSALTRGLAHNLVLLPLIYLVVAALRRPGRRGRHCSC